jgi:hypothetical protein
MSVCVPFPLFLFFLKSVEIIPQFSLLYIKSVCVTASGRGHSGQSGTYGKNIFTLARAGRSGRTSGSKNPFVRPEIGRPTFDRRFHFSPRTSERFPVI